jgi:hypothetical protein
MNAFLFMTDCVDNKRLSIAEVFPNIPIYFYIYYVQKTWTKKLLELFKSSHERRTQINAALKDLCLGSTLISDGDGLEIDQKRFAMIKLAIFYQRFPMEKEFIQIFLTRLGTLHGYGVIVIYVKQKH